MMNNLYSNPVERKCRYCETDKIYMAVTKRGFSIKNGLLIHSKKILRYVEIVTKINYVTQLLLPILIRQNIRKSRSSERIYRKCGSNSLTRMSEKFITTGSEKE